MNDQTKAKLPNPFLDKRELQMIHDSLELAATSYKRTQKQRPEFEAIAKQLEADIRNLANKIFKEII